MHCRETILCCQDRRERDLSQRLLSELIRKLEGLSKEERGRQGLLLSALLTEYAAFELAESTPSNIVGGLIETSAHLSATADEISSEHAAEYLPHPHALQ